MRRLVLAAALALELAAAPALICTPSPAAAATAPAGSATGHVRILLTGIFAVHRSAVTVPGRRIVAVGLVRPWAGGQSVTVRVALGRTALRTERLRIRAGADRRGGRFAVTLTAPAAGILHITVVHPRTAGMRGWLAARAVAVLAPHAAPGSRGEFVDLIQQRLAALHVYVTSSGVFDSSTALALDAYHRLLREGVAGTLDAATVAELLDGRGAFPVRYPRDGTHAEGNLSLQLLALIHGSQVDRIYPISSGKPSTPTVLGRYRVYERVPGYLPDGMYYSSFFTGGYAIHGYDPAPDYPASHGCMRLPIADAISAFEWLGMGDPVDVYR